MEIISPILVENFGNIYKLQSGKDIVHRRGELIYDDTLNDKTTDKFKIDPEYYNQISQYNCVDVLVVSPLKPYSFQSIVALDKNTNKIIGKSNTYINDSVYHQVVDEKDDYSIYHRINYTADILMTNNYSLKNEINNETNNKIIDESILFANAFSYANSGHDLSIVNYCINYYLMNIKDKNPDCKIILMSASKKCPRILEYIEIFIPASQFIFIEHDTIYTFKNIHIPYSHQFNINQFMPLFHYAVKYVNEHIHNLPDNNEINVIPKQLMPKLLMNQAEYIKPIFMVKTKRHNVMTKQNSFECDEVSKYLEKKGYAIINPEAKHMWEIIAHLSNTKKLIISYGAILYTHQNFIPKTTKLMFITAIGEVPYPAGIKRGYTLINTNTKNLDKNMKDFLKRINE